MLAAEPISVEVPGGLLHGTLEDPAGAPPQVCALIVAGSGPTDRDGNQAGLRNDSLKQLARALAQRGVCTLRYDKRGVGASTEVAAAESDLRFEHFVADAQAWIARLRSVRRGARVAVIGHSEGALVGLLAAKRAKAAAVVSLAGAGRPAAQLIGEQLERLPAGLRRRGQEILAELAAGRTVTDMPMELGALFRPSIQPYLMSWFPYDPAAEIRAPGMPVLILQGTADLQVPVSEARILAAADPLAALRLVPNMNHVLKPCLTPEQQRAAYTDPKTPIDEQAAEEIARFLLTPP